MSPALPAAVVFDCDGVLIESVELKTRAFGELFADHPEHIDAIVEHHQANLGISRYEKFDWIYRHLLGQPLGEVESQRLGERFSQIVRRGVRGCPEVPGATDTLRTLADRAVPLFIASGTPQEELDGLIAARGWTELFARIYGSPATKADVLRGIAHSLATEAQRLVFVGDGASDFEAARATGAHFVLRETAAQAERFRDYQGPRITDLRGFAERVTTLLEPPAD